MTSEKGLASRKASSFGAWKTKSLHFHLGGEWGGGGVWGIAREIARRAFGTDLRIDRGKVRML